MRKCTLLAVPAFIAILTFGVCGKTMAETSLSGAGDDQVVVPVAVGLDGSNVANDQSIAAKDTLNGNSVTVKDVDNNTTISKTSEISKTSDISKSTDIDIDKSNAKAGKIAASANDESYAYASDYSANSKGKVSAANSGGQILLDSVDGADGALEDGGSGAYAYDYSASAKDHSVAFTSSKVGRLTEINAGDIQIVASVSELNGAVSGNKLSFGNDLDMSAKGNKGGDAYNDLYQKNKSYQKNDLDQKNKPDASNDLDQKNKPYATNSASGANGDISASNTSSQSASSGTATSEEGNANAKASNDADLDNKSGETNKSDQDNKIGKESNKAIQANLIGKESNKSDQDNSAKGENEAFQASLATTGDYSNTQTQTVSLATGDNYISGTITANGINPIALNTGIQSSVQQQVNVQANVNTNPVTTTTQ
jgi:hypothetical protein